MINAPETAGPPLREPPRTGCIHRNTAHRTPLPSALAAIPDNRQHARDLHRDAHASASTGAAQDDLAAGAPHIHMINARRRERPRTEIGWPPLHAPPRTACIHQNTAPLCAAAIPDNRPHCSRSASRCPRLRPSRCRAGRPRRRHTTHPSATTLRPAYRDNPALRRARSAQPLTPSPGSSPRPFLHTDDPSPSTSACSPGCARTDDPTWPAPLPDRHARHGHDGGFRAAEPPLRRPHLCRS